MKHNSKSQAGTKADSEQKDEDIFISQHSRKLPVGSSPSFVITGQTPTNIKFFADGNYWLLSNGIIGINNVTLIQKTLPNE